MKAFRVLDIGMHSEGRGHRFESCRARHINGLCYNDITHLYYGLQRGLQVVRKLCRFHLLLRT